MKLFKIMFISMIVLLLSLSLFNHPACAESSKMTITIQSDETTGKAKLSDSTVIIKDEAFMTIIGYLSTADVTKLYNDLLYLNKLTEVRTVHIFINSGGGSAFAGLALSDEIIKAQKNGFKIIAHASGIIASATVTIYAVCAERIATPGTLFMVHQPSFTKFFTTENADEIRAQNELMDIMRDRYLRCLAIHTNLPLPDWKAMEVRTTWFDADKSVEIGLTDKIE